MEIIHPPYATFFYPLLLIVFFFIKTPSKVNTVKLGYINKILFVIEFSLIIIVLLLALSVLMVPNIIFSALVFLSIMSMVSLFVLMIQTMIGSEKIQLKFIYTAHLGLFLVLVGVLGLYDPEVGNHSRQVPPYAIFLFGVVNLIPYFHLMIVQNFFSQNNQDKLEY